MRHAVPLLITAVAMTTATMTTSAAEETPFVIPLMTTPPTIDGKLDPAEWAASAGFAGFTVLDGGQLERRRSEGRIGADAANLYVAIRTQLPDAGELATAVTRDSTNVVYDDAIEAYVDPAPGATDRVVYQFLANAIGAHGYQVHLAGSAKADVNWNGGWRQANARADGWWTWEAAIPLASLPSVAAGRTADQGAWRVNLCRDWKPDWGWSLIAGNAYNNGGALMSFTAAPAPGIACAWQGDPTFPAPSAVHTLTATNPGKAPLAVALRWRLERNNMPELHEERTATIAPGQRTELTCPIDVNDPTGIYTLTVEAAAPDGSATWYRRTTTWKRARAASQWVAGAAREVPPLAVQFAHYPSQERLRVRVDLGGMPKTAKPGSVSLAVRKAGGAPLVQEEIPASAFTNGTCERELKVPGLDGAYELVAEAHGEGVPGAPVVSAFERTRFPWEGTQLGRSATVYAPFTPIALADHELRTVLRRHRLNDFGLWDQVAATSWSTGVEKPLLAAPMRYVATVAGADAPVVAGATKTVESAGNRTVLAGRFTAGALKAAWTATWEYDGCMRTDLTLAPTGGVAVDALTLEIPLSSEAATLIHANSDRIRAPVAGPLPAGEGVVWDATKLACDDYIKNFCPYVYLGGAERGLAFFAENDRGWRWDPKTPSVTVVRHSGQVVLRVHLVNQPGAIDAPRTITFGLQAAPVKPPMVAKDTNANWWRHRYQQDRFHLLGTDINWGAVGDCGSVYPMGNAAGAWYWEELAKGNKGTLSDDELQATVKRGLAEIAPWADLPDQFAGTFAGSFKHHMEHNLRGNRDARMVFYYNRASNQLAPEFETFKDEWTGEDWRTGAKGIGRGEVKCWPTDSWMDMHLWWYAKSFEMGNNQGVYWDNWFFAPSFNTGASAAYRRADGSVVPSTGLWGMREMAKRTFTMMNEQGRTPIVFPHMTSFAALPLLSFATLQYDWEWKYSEGDVQDRFSREYIQLVSGGQLTGTWGVTLHDQGAKSQDPWTVRTFAAVQILHELDTTEYYINQAKDLYAPVLAVINHPETIAYRYWEDRGQPVRAVDADLPCIVYDRPGIETLIAFVSYAAKDLSTTATVDTAALRLPAGWTATDAESGKPVPVADGRLVLEVKKHDIRLVRIAKP